MIFNKTIFYPEPSTLNTKELIKTYDSLNRAAHKFWHFSEDGRIDEFNPRYQRYWDFLEGLSRQIDKYRDAYLTELECRTGIDRDPVWYDYSFNMGIEPYNDFIWLVRRMHNKCDEKSMDEIDREMERILENAGYVATAPRPYSFMRKKGWEFVGKKQSAF